MRWWPRSWTRRVADRVRTLILGAAGRDVHDFAMLFRDDPASEVVAFTAARIPGIEGRRLPPSLTGPLCPDGIPVLAEAGMEALVPVTAVCAVRTGASWR
jgi:predicted GTPase